ncbi:MAG: cytochrome P450 [Actinomycetota bacterium]
MTDLDELAARFAPDDPAFIADPYPALGAIREATPIFRNERSDQWMVTRFADVATLLRHPGLGRAYQHRYSDEEFGRTGPDPQWANFNQHERWSLLFLEPPDHTRIRRLLTGAFTPRSIAALTDDIRGHRDRLLDHCVELSTFDLLTDYAQPFSVGVICSLLGVPAGDEQQLLDWSHAIVKMYEITATDEQRRAADDAAGAFIDYVQDLLDHKRRHPDDKLISELARVRVEGEALTDPQIVSTTMVLLEAGHEATVNTLGNGFRALLQHPDQWGRLLDGSVAPTVAVEELLRWDPPLQLFARYVLEPGIGVGDVEFAVGDEVAMLFGSAQRDPRRFDDPDTFDVGRGDRAHVGFGGGIHFCPGAHLSRVELTESIAGIRTRFPDLTLAAEPAYYPTFVIRGLTELRCRRGGD